MIIALNELLTEYGWIYERDYGDRGIVLAESYEEAIEKLSEIYPDTKGRIKKTEENSNMISGWMYVSPIENYKSIGDVFVVQPW